MMDAHSSGVAGDYRSSSRRMVDITEAVMYGLLIIAGALGYFGYVFVTQSTQQFELCRNTVTVECDYKWHVFYVPCVGLHGQELRNCVKDN
jgi:hypothetical protein